MGDKGTVDGLVCCASENLNIAPNYYANYIFGWNGCVLLNVVQSSPCRKTACFYCLEGQYYLKYSYNDQDKFACHNFACGESKGGDPLNCDMHGLDEWSNVTNGIKGSCNGIDEDEDEDGSGKGEEDEDEEGDEDEDGSGKGEEDEDEEGDEDEDGSGKGDEDEDEEGYEDEDDGSGKGDEDEDEEGYEDEDGSGKGEEDEDEEGDEDEDGS